jgi:hypothetical protein
VQVGALRVQGGANQEVAGLSRTRRLIIPVKKKSPMSTGAALVPGSGAAGCEQALAQGSPC